MEKKRHCLNNPGIITETNVCVFVNHPSSTHPAPSALRDRAPLSLTMGTREDGASHRDICRGAQPSHQAAVPQALLPHGQSSDDSLVELGRTQRRGEAESPIRPPYVGRSPPDNTTHTALATRGDAGV